MSPEKMIGFPFAAPAAKLYEVFDKLKNAATELSLRFFDCGYFRSKKPLLPVTLRGMPCQSTSSSV